MFLIVVLLIPFSALALGAVHPWAYRIMEEAAFAATALWMVWIAAGHLPAALPSAPMRRVLVPATLFLTVAALQLLPLPPSIERVIFPATYRIYRASLPGWPQQAPYQWLQNPAPAPERYLLPTESEVRFGLPVPFAPPAHPPAPPEKQRPTQPRIDWRPLSMAPGL